MVLSLTQHATSAARVTLERTECISIALGVAVLECDEKRYTGDYRKYHKQCLHCLDDLLPPPKKEVMFLVRSVCLSVRRITRKLVNGF